MSKTIVLLTEWIEVLSMNDHARQFGVNFGQRFPIRSSSFIYGDGRTVYVYTGEWIFTNSLHDSPADPSGIWTHIISNPISIEKWTWVNFYRYSLNWGFETFYRDRLIRFRPFRYHSKAFSILFSVLVINWRSRAFGRPIVWKSYHRKEH